METLIDSSERKSRCVDVVLCIDGTGSMTSYIEAVKKSAMKFRDDLIEQMVRLGSDIDAARVKVIVFRDYGHDGGSAMQFSRFFQLPQDEEDYAKFLVDVNAGGGGDDPENGLEAVYFAMQSEFMTGNNDRQVIVLFTDADAHDLRKFSGLGGYPEDMVDEAGLKRYWLGISQEGTSYLNQRTKRLVIFAPPGTKYDQLATDLDKSWYQPTTFKDGGMGQGMNFDDVIALIAKSATS